MRPHVLVSSLDAGYQAMAADQERERTRQKSSNHPNKDGDNLNWSTLKIVYSGIIGNTIFLLSFFSLLSAIPYIDKIITNRNIAYALTGAIFISTSYLLYNINIPYIVKKFSDTHEYYDHLLKLKELMSLDYVHEFSVLEFDKEVKKLPVFSDNTFNLKKFENTKKYKEFYGSDRSLFFLSIIKYDYINNMKSKIRWFLTIMFIIGISLIYFAPVNRIFKIILGGFIE